MTSSYANLQPALKVIQKVSGKRKSVDENRTK